MRTKNAQVMICKAMQLSTKSLLAKQAKSTLAKCDKSNLVAFVLQCLWARNGDCAHLTQTKQAQSPQNHKNCRNNQQPTKTAIKTNKTH